MKATDGESFRLRGGTLIMSCEITGCRGDAFRVSAHSDENEESINNAVIEFTWNYLHDNSGAGILLDWNGYGDQHAYMQLKSWGNMIVENGVGVHYVDLVADSLQQGLMLNDTIAGNASKGFVFDGTLGSSGVPAPSLENCIIWGNNTGGVQYGGTANWDPCDDSGMRYSDWMGLSGTLCTAGNGNIDEDPWFSGSGDYHLTNNSGDVIDKGDNMPAAPMPAFDLDGDDRTIDGDGNGSETVDMGADEYDPDA